VTQGAVARGDGLVPMERENPAVLHGEHAGRGWIYARVDDQVAHIARARATGAELLNDLHAIPGEGGHQGYTARDLEGNLWTFGSAPIER
jgi:hypothetical protein